MRVIFNHMTIGLLYKDFWRLGPAFIGTLVSFLYQLINLYGFLPAIFLVGMGIASITVLSAYTLQLLSLFFIPVSIGVLVVGLILAVSLLAWLLINFKINRQVNLQILVLKYSSRTAFIGLSLLLCNRIIPLAIGKRARFWDVHFKPRIAGKIREYDQSVLEELLQEDYHRLQQALIGNNVLYGSTPGSLAKYFNHLPQNTAEIQTIITIIPPENAKVFGLMRNFYFHFLSVHKN